MEVTAKLLRAEPKRNGKWRGIFSVTKNNKHTREIDYQIESKPNFQDPQEIAQIEDTAVAAIKLRWEYNEKENRTSATKILIRDMQNYIRDEKDISPQIKKAMKDLKDLLIAKES